jgi:peptidoglycan/xylan/chitin deacetylase (PgdA/CDA1 family)
VSGWAPIEAALAARSRPLRLWWRDDDAGPFHPHLVPLLILAERHRVPLALAVVPAALALATQAAALGAGATVLQHGYAHTDHAAPGARRIELGGRPVETILTELDRGRARLEDAFGGRFLPVLVPPWNRIDEALVEHLPVLGYSGLSCFGAVPSTPAPGLRRIDTHLDLQDWRKGGAFAGEEALLERLSLLIERIGDHPLGLLTHHQRMDEAAFAWLGRLLALAAAAGARVLAADELFEAVP